MRTVFNVYWTQNEDNGVINHARLSNKIADDGTDFFEVSMIEEVNGCVYVVYLERFRYLDHAADAMIRKGIIEDVDDIGRQGYGQQDGEIEVNEEPWIKACNVSI